MERLTGHPSAAAEAFTAVNDLLPVLAWRGLDRVVREENLVRHAAVAREAAASAITAGRLELAVELLERGRALIWGQSLHIRSDLTALHEVAPGLAGRMREVRALLADLDNRPAGDAGAADREAAGQRYRRLAEEWEDLLDRARSIEGFADLLVPAPFARLREAARGGPVIVVNVAPRRCDALIVTIDGVRVVPLPDLTVAEAERMAAAFLHPTLGTARAPRDLAPHDRPPGPSTPSVLSWLWHAVARPVLDALGYGAPPADLHRWPRVWWCPTGPLSALPLHAAGSYPASASDAAPGAVPDRVISSYTPTLDALLRARAPRRTPGPGHGRLLSVGMATTPATADRPMLPALPAVPLELARIASHWESTTLLSPPLAPAGGAPATRQALLDALGNHGSVHLACHGVQDHTRPAASAVHVADGAVTALELASLTLPGAQLAFLSACATATGTSRLPDEAIHMSAALQVAGFRQIVATLWPVRDDLAPELADAFYAYLTRHGVPRPHDAPVALHHAVTQLRRRHPDPGLWAPYIHVGP
ncbi:CHAT domain-containing protein [Dactylosporangium sp. NPDC051541]|uniref:CHAT domain-containing protein n=1 Tax=Dactylosporangium sp. NPDC051541 TaxID=3363977 RepID=UPI0037AFD5F6